MPKDLTILPQAMQRLGRQVWLGEAAGGETSKVEILFQTEGRPGEEELGFILLKRMLKM